MEPYGVEVCESLRDHPSRFNQLAMQSRIVIWEVNATGLYTYVSPVAESVWGYHPGELTGKKHFYDIHPAEGRDQFREKALAVFNSGAEFINLLNPIQRKDGDIIWVSTNGLPMLADDGSLTGYQGSDTDVTERKKLQDKLEESELFYRSLFGLNAYGLVVIDADSARLIDFNDQVCDQLGYTRAELRNLKISDIDFVETPDQTKNHVRNVIKTGFDEFETLHRTKQGEVRAVKVSARYSQIGDKNVYHCIWRDITRQKKEAQIVEAKLKLIECSVGHSLEELLSEAINELEQLTGSSAGFFHLLQQNSSTLPGWPSRTGKSLRNGALDNRQQGTAPDDLWAECLRKRKPVARHDISSPRQGKGDAPFIREMAVPVIRSGKVVAVMGVRNKHLDYSDEELELAVSFADKAWDVVEHKIIEESLRESNQRFAVAFEKAPIVMAISCVVDGKCIDVNQKFVEVFEFSREETIGRTFEEIGCILPEERKKITEAIRADGHVKSTDLRYYSKSGKSLLLNYTGQIITIAGEKRLLSICMDLTEQRQLEHQLYHAQKMESVGRLAGGVAHDFNNILGVIIGYAELALSEPELKESTAEYLQQILDGARRSIGITRQLLAFARQQRIQPRRMNLNDPITSMLKMLRRLIGEDVKLAWNPGKDLMNVLIDPSQVDQVLANLCVNARDAIAGVGKIWIKTQNVHITTPEGSTLAGIPLGHYVLLTVSDNGCGMSGDILGSIFEPFYTTKEFGRGTGLGLSTVFGVLKQNNGHVKVSSEPGKGSIFRLYFVAEPAEELEEASDGGALPVRSGAGTILIVDDEADLVRLGARMLEKMGYQVLTAYSEREAIDIAGSYPGQIDLLLTDVIMPAMNGRELSDRIKGLRPAIRCVYMSGYTGDVIEERGNVDSRLAFIQKPFTIESLSSVVKERMEEVDSCQ